MSIIGYERKEIKLNENEPGKWSAIGEWKIDRDYYKIDDTIGPELDLKFNDTLVCLDKEVKRNFIPNIKIDYKPFTFIKISLLNNNRDIIKQTFFYRTYEEYCLTSCSIFQRYRTPFIYNEEYGFNENKNLNVYKGNPNCILEAGDFVVISLLSPWKIDVKNSKVFLEVLKNRFHVGPENITIEN